MKFSSLLMAAAALPVVSCGTLNGPISSGDFNPLSAPGANRKSEVVDSGATSFTPGQFVKSDSDSTGFYAKRPKGDVDANKMLKLGTRMKVIETDGVYLKVELDSGEVGYVPSVLVSDPNAPAAGMPGARTFGGPIAPVDNSLPIVPPSEAPPGGSIPTVIDPAAPNEVPVPPPTPAPETKTPAKE